MSKIIELVKVGMDVMLALPVSPIKYENKKPVTEKVKCVVKHITLEKDKHGNILGGRFDFVRHGEQNVMHNFEPTEENFAWIGKAPEAPVRETVKPIMSGIKNGMEITLMLPKKPIEWVAKVGQSAKVPATEPVACVVVAVNHRESMIDYHRKDDTVVMHNFKIEAGTFTMAGGVEANEKDEKPVYKMNKEELIDKCKEMGIIPKDEANDAVKETKAELLVLIEKKLK